MPIIKHEKINDFCSLCLWHIEEEEASLYNQFNLVDAGSELHTISNPVKRLEWLSARLSLKHLIDFHGCKFKRIYKDNHGKPFFSENHHISLAHSFPFAASIINLKYPTGIDMELVQPKLLKVAGKYLNEKEIIAIKDNEAKACVYWTCKEALFKMHGRRKISFKEHLEIQPFEFTVEGGLVDATAMVGEKMTWHKLKYFKVDNYYLSYCIS